MNETIRKENGNTLSYSLKNMLSFGFLAKGRKETLF